VQVVRERSSQDPNFAGTGDVNDVGTKSLQRFADKRKMSQKRWVESKIFFECEGEKAARQLKSPNCAIFNHGLGAIAGPHAEERKIAPARKSFKMAAGVRNTVYFMERIRKVGDPGNGSGASGVTGAC
jgi:hypothetical protein